MASLHKCGFFNMGHPWNFPDFERVDLEHQQTLASSRYCPMRETLDSTFQLYLHRQQNSAVLICVQNVYLAEL
jgi:hypothetical protein